MRSYFSLKTITKSKYQKELVGSELQRLLINVESAASISPYINKMNCKPL